MQIEIRKRSLCVSLVRKANLNYCNKLNHMKVSDNKTFWKTVKPSFTDKGANTTESCWLKKMAPFQIIMKYPKN